MLAAGWTKGGMESFLGSVREAKVKSVKGQALSMFTGSPTNPKVER